MAMHTNPYFFHIDGDPPGGSRRRCCGAKADAPASAAQCDDSGCSTQRGMAFRITSLGESSPVAPGNGGGALPVEPAVDVVAEGGRTG